MSFYPPVNRGALTAWTAVSACVVISLTMGARLWAQDVLPGPGTPPAEALADADAEFSKQLGYAFGLTIGQNLRREQAPLDLPSLMAGLSDALQGAEPKMSPQQVGQTMQRFEQMARQRAQAAAGANLKQGQAFLAENGKKQGVTTTASGLQYRVITPGSGAKPKATDTVQCHYEGRLISGKVFDASAKYGPEPAEFPLNRVIPGWTEALQLMPVGAKHEIYVPSNLAYGPQGSPPDIPPNATLIFTIELVSIVQR